MGQIKKILTIIPEEWRALAGKSDEEWTIDGDKINCGTQITVEHEGTSLTGRFEIGEDGPYLAGHGLKLKEGMTADFSD